MIRIKLTTTHMHAKLFDRILAKGPQYGILKSFLYIISSCALSTIIFVFIFSDLFFLKKGPLVKNLFLIYQSPAEEISPSFFFHLLNLRSSDPQHIRMFNTHDANEKLLSTGLFSYVKTKKNFDTGAVIIEYSLKTPLAILGNRTFRFIDSSGEVFPALPQFSSKRLPKIFFPETENSFPKIESQLLRMAKELIKDFGHEELVTVDLTTAHEYPYEIVLTLKNNQVVRLTTTDMQSKIKAYRTLHKYLEKSLPTDIPLVYDLRFSKSSLISRNQPKDP